MKTIEAAAVAALMAAGWLGAAPAVAGSYSFTTLALPPGADPRTLPRAGGLNDNDQIVGTFQTRKEIPHGFFWSNGISVQVDRGRYGTELTAINNAGVATGIFCLNAVCPGGGSKAATFDTGAGTSQALKISTTLNPRPRAINLSGTVAGFDGKTTKTQGFVVPEAGQPTFLAYPGAKATEALGVSDSGLVVGESLIGSRRYPFTAQSGDYTDIDPPNSRGVTGGLFITRDGQIAGDYYDMTVFRYRAYTLIGGAYTVYDVTQLNDVIGLGSNGEVVGDVGDDRARPHGFVSVGGTTYQIDPPGATQTQLISVNAQGSLFGLAKGSAGTWYFIAQCAPDQRPCTH